MILFKPVIASITVLIFNRRIPDQLQKLYDDINKRLLFASYKEWKNQKENKIYKAVTAGASAYLCSPFRY